MNIIGKKTSKEVQEGPLNCNFPLIWNSKRWNHQIIHLNFVPLSYNFCKFGHLRALKSLKIISDFIFQLLFKRWNHQQSPISQLS